jgi:hypothetical protein
MEMPSGVRIKPMRPSRGGRLIVFLAAPGDEAAALELTYNKPSVPVERSRPRWDQKNGVSS